MLVLGEEDNIIVKESSKRLYSDSSMVVPLLNKLENNELVERI